VVSFKPRPLYPRGKSRQCSLERRLDRSQVRSERCGVEKNLSSCWESNYGRPARSYTDRAIPGPCTVEKQRQFGRKFGLSSVTNGQLKHVNADKTVTFRLRGKPEEPALESGRSATCLPPLPGYVENVYCRLSLLGFGKRNSDDVYLIGNPVNLSWV
jgi:hypothetical protein